MTERSKRRHPSDRLSSLAARLIRKPEDATLEEIRSLAAAVLSLDVTPGKRDDA